MNITSQQTSSFAIVLKHPNVIKRGGKIVETRFQENALSIVAVPVDHEKGGLYCGQTLAAGNIYFHIQHPGEPNPAYQTDGYYQRIRMFGNSSIWSRKHFTIIDNSQPELIGKESYMVKAEKSHELVGVQLPSELPTKAFAKNMEKTVRRILEQLSGKISFVARKISFIPEDEYHYIKATQIKNGTSIDRNSEEDNNLFHKIFLGLIRSSKSGFIISQESNGTTESNGHIATEEQGRIKHIRRIKNPYLAIDNGFTQESIDKAYVKRTIDPKIPKSKTRRNFWRKETARIERRYEDKEMIEEGVQDFYSEQTVEEKF